MPSKCPECRGDLAVLRVIPAAPAREYWTMRCTDCGGIHLDIVDPRVPVEAMDDDEARRAADRERGLLTAC